MKRSRRVEQVEFRLAESRAVEWSSIWRLS